jgi:hypothetical protein
MGQREHCILKLSGFIITQFVTSLNKVIPAELLQQDSEACVGIFQVSQTSFAEIPNLIELLKKIQI